MTTPRTRRVFLQESGRLLAGLGMTSVLDRGASAATSAARIAVTCRDVMLRSARTPDCWSAMSSVDADGVEATITQTLDFPDLFHPQRKYSAGTRQGLEQLKADLQSNKRRITALCMYNRFEARPEVEIDWAARAARAAQDLGVKVIRIDVVPHKMRRGPFLDFAVATLKKVMEATEATGVCFGIENHGNTTNDPEFLLPLFDRVGSKRLGLTLDTGNFYWFGHPLAKVYTLFETFAPRVFHTHCKSIKFPADQREKQRPMGWEYARYTCPIDEGDIDFSRLVAILKKAGYHNDLCVEDESLGRLPIAERAEVLAREIRYLRKLA
jgi:sugar phosphate isomerase/epimerase